MKNTFKVRFLSMYFHNIMKAEYKNKSIGRKRIKDIAKEQKEITFRAGGMILVMIIMSAVSVKSVGMRDVPNWHNICASLIL